jgi:hypothetical protein
MLGVLNAERWRLFATSTRRTAGHQAPARAATRHGKNVPLNWPPIKSLGLFYDCLEHQGKLPERWAIGRTWDPAQCHDVPPVSLAVFRHFRLQIPDLQAPAQNVRTISTRYGYVGNTAPQGIIIKARNTSCLQVSARTKVSTPSHRSCTHPTQEVLLRNANK